MKTDIRQTSLFSLREYEAELQSFLAKQIKDVPQSFIRFTIADKSVDVNISQLRENKWEILKQKIDFLVTKCHHSGIRITNGTTVTISLI